jgi:murein DD-endopeptidase MepM/ murein hydrolase activator NlpD
MPASVPQGHSFQLKVMAPAGATVTATMDGQPLKIFPRGATIWLAYLGFDPQAAVAPHTVVVSDGPDTIKRSFEVTAVNWPVENITTNRQQDQVSSGNKVADENAFLRSYFLTYTPKQLWSGTFAYPVQAPLTDGFGVFRSYNGGPANTYHEGRDLGAWTGTPIYAPAAGKVVLARALTVRGNGVVIDHGLGVFSGYYHQSKIAVQEGQMINKGDLIGYVGDTGFANGPHLHWELRIGNRYVDPDEWTKTAFGAATLALTTGPQQSDIS